MKFFPEPSADVKYEDGYVAELKNDLYNFQLMHSGEEIQLTKDFVRQPVSFRNEVGGSVRNGFIDIDESYDDPNVQLYGLDGEKRNYVGNLKLGWLVNG